MSSRSRGAKAAFLFTGCLTTFAISSFAVISLVYAWFDWKVTAKISGPPPSSFAVVLVTPLANSGRHSAQVLWQKDVEAFAKSHPDASFVVPPAEVESLRATIRASTRSAGNKEASLWFATFTLKEQEDGSQEVTVDATNNENYVNRSWYVVRNGRVMPERHLNYFGPGVGMAFGLPTCLVLAIVNFLIWRRTWR